MGALTLWQYIGDFGCERLARLCLIDQSPRITVDAGWKLGLFGSLTASQLHDKLSRARQLRATR